MASVKSSWNDIGVVQGLEFRFLKDQKGPSAVLQDFLAYQLTSRVLWMIEAWFGTSSSVGQLLKVRAG